MATHSDSDSAFTPPMPAHVCDAHNGHTPPPTQERKHMTFKHIFFTGGERELSRRETEEADEARWLEELQQTAEGSTRDLLTPEEWSALQLHKWYHGTRPSLFS